MTGSTAGAASEIEDGPTLGRPSFHFQSAPRALTNSQDAPEWRPRQNAPRALTNSQDALQLRLEAVLTVAEDDSFDDESESYLWRRLTAVIAEFGTPDLLKALPLALAHQRVTSLVRAEVLRAVAAINDESTETTRASLLAAYLSDRDSRVRHGAVLGLFDIGDRRVAEALSAALQVEKNRLVRGTIEATLVRLNG